MKTKYKCAIITALAIVLCSALSLSVLLGFGRTAKVCATEDPVELELTRTMHRVSKNNDYLLLVTAFNLESIDDEKFYILGYDVNDEKIETTTFYSAFILPEGSEGKRYEAVDVFGAQCDGWGMIIYETTYDPSATYDYYAYIKEIEPGEDFPTDLTDYETVDTIEGVKYANVKCGVTFDSNGGSSVSSQSINKYRTASEPSDPTKSGYEFLGWYDGETEFDFSTVITDDVTLKAHWGTSVTYTGGYAVRSDSKIALTLSNFSKSISGVDAVKVNGAAAGKSEASGTLTVDCTALGSVDLKIVVDDNEYNCTITVADYVISTKAQFKEYFTEAHMNDHEYTVLANDIDIGGDSWTNYKTGYSKVFDGLGHTVSDFNIGEHGLVRGSSSGTIKNVTFDNMKYGNQGIFGGTAYHSSLTVENVTVNASQTKAGDHKTLLFFRNNGHGVSFTNCTFNITAYSTETDVYYQLFENDAYYTVTMNNVTVNYTGTMYKFGETCKKRDYSTDMTFGTKVTYSDVRLKDIRDTRVDYDAEYVLVSGGNVVFDQSKFSKTVSGVTAVTVNGSSVAATESAGNITVPCSALGKVAFRFTMAEDEYTLNITVADYAISTKAQFKDYFTQNHMNLHDYTVLAKNIDMQNESWTNYDQSFTKVFDGLNHTVSNLTIRSGLVYKSVSGTIKNVTFDNYGYGNMGLFGGSYTSGLTVENVTINAHQTEVIADKTLLLKQFSGNNVSFTNCNFNITAYAGQEDIAYMLFKDNDYYKTTMTNVTINYTGTMVKFGETGVTTGGAEVTFGNKVTRTNVTLTDKRDS